MRLFHVLAIALIFTVPASCLAGSTLSPSENESKLTAGGRLCTSTFPALNSKYNLPTYLLGSIASVESGRWESSHGISVPWPWTITTFFQSQYYDTKAEAVQAAKNLLNQKMSDFYIGCTQVHYDGTDLEKAFEPSSNVEVTAAALAALHDKDQSWEDVTTKYGDTYSRPSNHENYRKRVLASEKEIRRAITIAHTKPDEGAGCHFKTPDALLCADPEVAAMVYREYGFNSALIRQSYSARILTGEGCITAASYRPVNYGNYKKEWKPLKAEMETHGQIAELDGWVGVYLLDITMDHSPVYPDSVAGYHFSYYVADSYVEGKCKKATPPLGSLL